jgi:hypothetical protein
MTDIPSRGCQVIFCTKSTDPYTFRAPVDSDYLGSHARQRFMFPKYEINLEQYWAQDSDQGFMVIEKSNIGELVAWQKLSAVGHWSVIRTVVPAAVWENY